MMGSIDGGEGAGQSKGLRRLLINENDVCCYAMAWQRSRLCLP